MKFIRYLTFILIILVSIMPVLSAPKPVFLDVGDRFVIDEKTITLENVGEGGAILVDVDGVRESISASNTKTVNGIEITNDETYYTNEVSERSAILILNFPDDCYDSVKNQDETDVDCGGSICEPCNVGMMCIEDSDCLDGICYDNKCVKCTNYVAPVCSGKLISKGTENGCNLGYTCCEDGICSEWEDEEICPDDCEPELVVYVNEEKEELVEEYRPICYDKDQDGFLSGDCNEDCDDNDPYVNNYAYEILDGKDNNCDGEIDEGLEIETKEVSFFKKIFSKLFGWF
ncbi:MAG: MopE-related protein [Nanoarchaeota archaeon]